MNIGVLFSLGVLYVTLDQAEEARDILLKVNMFRPFYEPYMVALAICHFQLGDFSKSLLIIDECVKLSDVTPLAYIVGAFLHLEFRSKKKSSDCILSKNLLAISSLDKSNLI